MIEVEISLSVIEDISDEYKHIFGIILFGKNGS